MPGDTSLLLLFLAGIDEISVDVYKGVEHSDSEDSDKSDSSDSEYASDEEQKTKEAEDAAPSDEAQKDSAKSKAKDQPSPSQEEGEADSHVASETTAGDGSASASDAPTRAQASTGCEKESPEKTKAPPASPSLRERAHGKEEAKQAVPVEDSDSERELVIDLGEEQGAKDRKRSRKDNASVKEASAAKTEGESPTRNNQTHTQCDVYV